MDATNEYCYPSDAITVGQIRRYIALRGEYADVTSAMQDGNMPLYRLWDLEYKYAAYCTDHGKGRKDEESTRFHAALLSGFEVESAERELRMLYHDFGLCDGEIAAGVLVDRVRRIGGLGKGR